MVLLLAMVVELWFEGVGWLQGPHLPGVPGLSGAPAGVGLFPHVVWWSLAGVCCLHTGVAGWGPLLLEPGVSRGQLGDRGVFDGLWPLLELLILFLQRLKNGRDTVPVLVITGVPVSRVIFRSLATLFLKTLLLIALLLL